MVVYVCIENVVVGSVVIVMIFFFYGVVGFVWLGFIVVYSSEILFYNIWVCGFVVNFVLMVLFSVFN